MSNTDQIVDGVLRHGTRNPRRIADAARVLPELVRRLNVVTLDCTLTDPDDVNSIVQALQTTMVRLPQLLRQLAGDLRGMQSAANLTVHSSVGVDAPKAARLAAAALQLAASEITAVEAALREAAAYTDRLNLDDGEDGD